MARTLLQPCVGAGLALAIAVVMAPALLIVGSNDQFAKSPKNAIFAKTIPETEEVEIDGGIFLPAESPGPFAEAVQAFLG